MIRKNTMAAHWVSKFKNAFHGCYAALNGQSSFVIHFGAAALVIVAAAILQCGLVEWCVLLLCIGLVISMELVNTAIECLAHALCKEHNADVGRSLDIASAAVLVAAMCAAAIGVLILGNRAWLAWYS